MELKFVRLMMHNFGVFNTPTTFELSALGDGVHFIRGRNLVNPRLGSNGAGKSTIWNAMMWGLFGRTVAGLRGTDVKPWESTKGPTRVEVTVALDGEEHVIARATTSNGLWIDGKVVAQETIDAMLGLSVATFPHTILLGQRRDLFFDLKASQKLEVLSEVLQLDRWEVLSHKARDKSNDIAKQLSDAQNQLTAYERELTSASDNVRAIKQQMETFRNEQDERDAQREKELKLLDSNLQASEDELATHDLAYDSAETELRHAQREFDKAAAEYSSLSAQYSALFAEYEIKEKERKRLARVSEEFVEGDDCPTCGQTIKGTDFAEHGRRARKAVKEAEKIAQAAHRSCEAAGSTRNECKMRKEKWESDVRTYRKASDAAVDKRTQVQGRVQKIKGELRALKKQIEQTEEQPNPYSDLLLKARSDVKKIKQAIAQEKELAVLLERRHTRTKYWVDGFKNIRLHLLQEALDELQAVTQTLLPQVGLDGWVVLYAMERENKKGDVTTGLNVSILKPKQSNAVKWEAWSGGEGQRLRLIGAVALSEVLLRRAGVECSMMVLDEPTTHLSPEGVDETCDFLVDRGFDHQLFYVDHAAIESSRFASVITVTRDDAGARIKINSH